MSHWNIHSTNSFKYTDSNQWPNHNYMPVGAQAFYEALECEE